MWAYYLYVYVCMYSQGKLCWSFCLLLGSAGITGMPHLIWLITCRASNTKLCTGQTHALPLSSVPHAENWSRVLTHGRQMTQHRAVFSALFVTLLKMNSFLLRKPQSSLVRFTADGRLCSMRSGCLKSTDYKTGTSQDTAMFRVGWIKWLATLRSYTGQQMVNHHLLLHFSAILKSETSPRCSDASSIEAPCAVRCLFSLGGISDSKVLESSVYTSVSAFSSSASGYLFLAMESE